MSFNLASHIKFSSIRSHLAAEKTRPFFGFSKLPIVFLLVFTAMIAVDRVAVPQVPFNVDPAFYAVVTHELLQGKSLYTDVWDHKPPAIFIAYALAELSFGYSPQTLVSLNIFASLVILFGVYYAGKAGRGGVVSGLWAAALWVIVSGTFQLEGRDPNTEPFINACIIWAFALLVHNRTSGLTPKISIVIGLLFVFGSFFKPVVVAIALFLTCAHIIVSTDRKKAVKDALIIGSVGAGAWLALFGYFAVTGRFEVFYKAIFSYNRYYSGDLWANVMAPLRGDAEFFADFTNPLVVFAAIGIILAFVKNRHHSVLLAAYIGASWVAIALPGRFSVHYFQLWLPPLVVGAGWALGSLTDSKAFRFRLASYAAGVSLIAILMFIQAVPYKSVFANDWTPVIPVLNAGDNTAKEINRLLAPGETFFLWGNTPSLYLVSGRRPPAAVLFDSHLAESPVYEQLTNRVKSDLARERPEMLVVESGRPPVPDWIAQDYDPTPVYQNRDTYSFYLRRGGRLANEINPTSPKK